MNEIWGVNMHIMVVSQRLLISGSRNTDTKISAAVWAHVDRGKDFSQCGMRQLARPISAGLDGMGY